MVEKHIFKIATNRHTKEILESNDISNYNKEILEEYSSDLTVIHRQKDGTICNNMQIIDLVFNTVHTDLNSLKKDIKRILIAIETNEMPDGRKWYDATKFNYKAKIKKIIT